MPNNLTPQGKMVLGAVLMLLALTVAIVVVAGF